MPLTKGQTLRQPDLGGTLARLRVAGVGDMYQGALAQRIVRASVDTGGPIALTDLRGALPKLAPPLVRAFRNDKVAFLPPPADGGLAAEAAFDVLADSPNDIAGADRALPWRSSPVSRRRYHARCGARGEGPARGRSLAVPGLNQFRDHGSIGQRRGMRADDGQSVRHRADPAWPWLPGRGLAGRRAAALAVGRAGVE